MTTHLPKAAAAVFRFLEEAATSATAAGGEELYHNDTSYHNEGQDEPGVEVTHGEDGHSFGVHVTYTDLYYSFLFLTTIYISGKIAARLMMPDLVGEIVAGKSFCVGGRGSTVLFNITDQHDQFSRISQEFY